MDNGLYRLIGSCNCTGLSQTGFRL